MLLLNQGNDNYYLYVAIIVVLILLMPAIIMTILGLVWRKKKPKTARILFIITGVYLLIGFGYCGLMSI